ncbi:amidase [Penicillium longicatenatum]|uniref:amidase n=1 Tax=Penicillium longicatenatum TaxID=1561947 RepID=UPI00254879A6|nr:amidase [Penicillium longicatenatum]KAJ5635176.1 amidase [Penicillium longicatenatum]
MTIPQKHPESWETKAAIPRAIRDASLAKVTPPLTELPESLPQSSRGLPKQLLTPREFDLTENYTVTELLAKLHSRELSSEELTRAFLRRAAIAQKATNCLTDLLWDNAIERARYLDSLPAPLGPLHGLPISTKEHHGAKGGNETANASYVAYIGKFQGSTVSLDILWDAGCVFFARTTQPQTIMHLETESNIYGRTVNPYNRLLTSGGSSGGESALIGMRGSVLGVGGDIGGSIRCPAAHCGIYGFKPSAHRLPIAGGTGHMAGREAILSTNGPMSADRDSLELFMKVMLDAEPWKLEPSIRVAPWIPYGFTRPLKIAVQWWDGVVKPHPPMIRALREVSDACEKAGMTVVDWECESLDHKKGWEILSGLYFPDGGKEVLGLLESAGEPILPLTNFIIKDQPAVKELTVPELFKLCAEREAYRTSYARHWTSTGKQDGQEVDIILCPPSFGAATPHEQSRYWGYTSIWNLLDYPGVVFPVTKVDREKDSKDLDYQPKNEEDQFVYDLYEPDLYDGCPINLQIVGRRHHDEKVLAALYEVERAMGK